MKCPFELPVTPLKRNNFYRIRNKTGGVVADFMNCSEADYIVQAINSHELHKKLVAMLNQYLTEEFWYGQPKLAIDTMCEALKKAEKP